MFQIIVYTIILVAQSVAQEGPGTPFLRVRSGCIVILSQAAQKIATLMLIMHSVILAVARQKKILCASHFFPLHLGEGTAPLGGGRAERA